MKRAMQMCYKRFGLMMARVNDRMNDLGLPISSINEHKCWCVWCSVDPYAKYDHPISYANLPKTKPNKIKSNQLPCYKSGKFKAKRTLQKVKSRAIKTNMKIHRDNRKTDSVLSGPCLPFVLSLLICSQFPSNHNHTSNTKKINWMHLCCCLFIVKW